MNCSPELRQINGNNSPAGPVSVATSGAGVRIFKANGPATILEISIQTESDAHLQIVEGGSAGLNTGTPMTAVRFVQQYQLWSEAGKAVANDLYLIIFEPGVLCDVTVRYQQGS